MLVVTHVLIDQPSLNVNALVVLQKRFHSGELDQGIVKFLSTTVHESQVEHGSDESAAVFKCVAEKYDGMLNLVLLLHAVVVFALGDCLCLRLVGKTLSVVKLRIPVFFLDGCFEILVGQMELLLIQTDVTSVEIVVSVCRIVIDSFFIHGEGSFQILHVVEGQSKILLVEGKILL